MTGSIKVFTTRTLLKIVLVLVVFVALKSLSVYYDFSWASALASD